MERRNKPLCGCISKTSCEHTAIFFYHCTLPVWSLPPVFFIPIGLMVYFSLCFHLTLFCSREAVVRKPLHWITALLGTWAPSLLHAAACQHQKEPRSDCSWCHVYCLNMADRTKAGGVFTWEETNAGRERVRERRARVRHDSAITTRTCRLVKGDTVFKIK